MQSAIFALIHLFFVCGILFCVIIFPIWMLIHCAISQSRSGKSKAIWIISMILTWPITSLLYGLFGSKRKVTQWISVIMFFGLVVLVCVFFFGLYKISDIASVEINNMLSKIDQIEMPGITQNEQTKLKEGLSALKKEIKFGPPASGLDQLDKMSKASSLMQLFDIVAKDNKITLTEYNEWMDKFESREILDREELRQYIRNLEEKQN